ncbi:hypothetical protein EVAR_16487_1 [Eumeta japonica]|uniref:Retrovirus-related Pol polyprotein from type-1 retrotransposable element R1 4 n=1 Tax=Eumeta variegata TaxID=151549 RepID=A0A4C1UKF2_EUMVA|nr:hypothetical protein EVAR_16487_1 [Eumeta japonica]
MCICGIESEDLQLVLWACPLYDEIRVQVMDDIMRMPKGLIYYTDLVSCKSDFGFGVYFITQRLRTTSRLMYGLENRWQLEARRVGRLQLATSTERNVIMCPVFIIAESELQAGRRAESRTGPESELRAGSGSVPVPLSDNTTGVKNQCEDEIRIKA